MVTVGSACSCDDPDEVLVFDRNLAMPYVDGNPYGRFCRSCKRRVFCSEDFWKNADEKYVIPEGEEEPVHVSEFDGDQYENFFECIAENCREPHFGKPSGCGCGAEYNWD